jgi:hypothetical protein
MVVPLEGADEGVQVTGMRGDVVDGNVGRLRWLLTWVHQLLRWTHGWCKMMNQGEGLFTRAPWCVRSLGECQTIALDVSKHERRSASRKLGERGRKQAGESGLQGWPSVHVGRSGRLQSRRCPRHPLCCPRHKAPFSLPQSVAFTAGTIVHPDVIQLLPVGGVEYYTWWHWNGRRIASVVVPGPQAAPVIPEMAPCNVSAVSPMAACITYELPVSLLKLICDERVSANSLQRVALPTVSKLAAAAELHYRMGGAGTFCKEEQRRDPDGKLLCLVFDQRRVKRYRYAYMPQKEMRQHVAAHILRKHITPNACEFCGVCVTPPTLVAKARGMQAGIQCGSWYGVAFYYQSAITGEKCSNVPMQCPYPPGCSVLLWKYGIKEHWAIAHSDHPRPESIIGTLLHCYIVTLSSTQPV